MSTNITLQTNNRKQQVKNPRRDPNYWGERREQWARYKARVGCDWAGINRTQIEVAAFLADIRRRGAA